LLAVQQAQIQKLKENLRELSETLQSNPDPLPVQPAAVPAAAPNNEQGELDRLQNEAALLSSQVSRLESIQAENKKLRAQLVVPSAGPFTAEEEQAIQRALRIRCINNLKQLGLAARVWGLDNKDTYPSNLILMTNEMNTPKILLCPADTNRPAALDWASFTAANCSYDYVAPGGSPNEPYRILFRCPIHGNLGLCDGSVQTEVAIQHPEWIVQKDGKLFLDRNATNKP